MVGPSHSESVAVDLSDDYGSHNPLYISACPSTLLLGVCSVDLEVLTPLVVVDKSDLLL